ncbi:MAG: hypothetical protein ACRDTG_24185 [Pseudonocardiaceae bacterium]
MKTLPNDDAQLLSELGEALRSAEITEDDLTQAMGAFTWRTIDDELAFAALVYDSSIQERELVRGESALAARKLIFESETVSVEVEATPDALIGRVVPPGRADISLLTSAGAVGQTTADDMGSFLLSGAPSGPVRLLCRTATARLVTDWIRL